MVTCVPFCSWYTQVTSRCWMPFSQVAEQGLHGPATHLSRRRKDSERIAARRGQLPWRARHTDHGILGQRYEGGRQRHRARQWTLEIISAYQSRGSKLCTIFVWTYMLISLGYIPRSETAGSHVNSTFSSVRSDGLFSHSAA